MDQYENGGGNLGEGEGGRARLLGVPTDQLATQIVSKMLLRKSGLAKFDEIVGRTIDILREDFHTELAAAQALRHKLESENAVLHSRLSASHSQLQVLFDEDIARLKAEHAAALGKAQAEAAAAHALMQSELARMQSEHTAGLARVNAEQARLQSEHATAVSRLQAEAGRSQSEHAAALARLQSEHAAMAGRMQGEHGAATSRMQAEQGAAISRLKTEQAAVLERLHADRSAAEAALNAQRDTARRALQDEQAANAVLRDKLRALEAAYQRDQHRIADSEKAGRDAAEVASRLKTELAETRHDLEELRRAHEAVCAERNELEADKHTRDHWTPEQSIEEYLDAREAQLEDALHRLAGLEAEKARREELDRERPVQQWMRELQARLDATEQRGRELAAELNRRDQWTGGRSIEELVEERDMRAKVLEQRVRELEAEKRRRDRWSGDLSIEQVLKERDAALEAAMLRCDQLAEGALALEADAAAWRAHASTQHDDFMGAVRREAHALRRGPDAALLQAGTAEEWLFLMSHLSTKAARAARIEDRQDCLSLVVRCAAACLNWHARMAAPAAHAAVAAG